MDSWEVPRLRQRTSILAGAIGAIALGVAFPLVKVVARGRDDAGKLAPTIRNVTLKVPRTR